MSPLNFPKTFPTLCEEQVSLRELSEEDIPSWFLRATDSEAADLAGDPVPASIDLGIAWVQRQRDLFLRQGGIRWAIVPSDSPVSIGTVGLTFSSTHERTAELGVVLARSHWSRGFGTTAARMAIRYGLSVLGLVEVRAEVLQRNPASIRMLEKAGLKFVRILPPTQDEPETMILYSLSQPSASAA